MKRLDLWGVWLGLQTLTCAALGDVVIHEIHYDPPDRTRLEEFVELHNAGPHAEDLSGWFFSGGIGFTFPEGTILEPGGYLIVAQSPDAWKGRASGRILGPFEGFLDSDGEEIALRDSNGRLRDRVDYRVRFPWPIASGGDGSSMELIHPGLDNDLGGSWRASSGSVTMPEEPIVLVAEQSDAWRFRKGTSEASDPASAWREPGFVEDGTWQDGRTPIGYGDDDDNTVLEDMMDVYSSVYLRRTFEWPETEPLPTHVRVRMYVDDGSIVWINGVEVGRFHVSEGEKAFDDRASGHEARWEEVLLEGARGFLRPGENLLAVHALNQTIRSNDFSIDMELIVPSRYELPPAPTPGEPNSVHSDNAPPHVRQVDHLPREPRSGEPIVVRAKVSDPDGVSSVSVRYQIVRPGAYVPAFLPLPHAQLLANGEQPLEPNPDFEDPANWTEVTLLDDGQRADEVPGDGVYTALLPPQEGRTLVRYRITVTDRRGKSATVPYPDDPSLNFACFVYDGVPPYATTRLSVHPDGPGHVWPAELMTSLPVYFLITRAADLSQCVAYNGAYQIPKANERARDAFNWEGTFVYDGIVYDHVRYRLRQANDRYGGAGKRSMRIRFRKGRYLQARDNYGRPYPTEWRTLNTGKMYDNKRVGNFGLTETLNSILWNMVGVPSPDMHTFHFRVIDGAEEAPAGPYGQYYGDFWGMFLAMEDYDPRFLDAHGLADGNLYKLKDGIFDGNQFKRNQGRFAVTTDEDFQNIRRSLRPTQSAAWLDQHVRYERWYPYHAVVEAIRHYDFRPSDTHSKNRAWYFEPAEGSPLGRLWTLPHDADASWGPNWNEGIDYSKQAIWTGADKEPYRQEYRNVIREFRDLIWTQDAIHAMIDDLAAIVGDFAAADRDRWRGAPSGDTPQYGPVGTQDFGTMEAKVLDMKRFAFVGWSGSTGPTVPAGGRAAYLDQLARAGGDSVRIPETPTVTAVTDGTFPLDRLVFETSPFRDPDGDETFASLQWRIAEVEAAETPFRPGEPRRLEGHAVWESGDLSEPSSRITIPATVVQVGHRYRVRVRMRDTTGRTSHWSEPVELVVGPPETAVPASLSVRITELMYHPFGGDEDLEFVELQNVGSQTVDLGGVRLSGGISFDFEKDGAPRLAPGEFIVVAKDRRVLEAYYDLTGVLVVGGYSGRLANGGEPVVLSYGELPILAFEYSDLWYPETDGLGHSLVILDPEGSPELWSVREGWTASAELLGSPGRPDGTPPPAGRILPGDLTLDGRLNVSDAVAGLGFLFGGPAPPLPCGASSIDDETGLLVLDLNGDDKVDLSDPIHLLRYLFVRGAPPALGTECVRVPGCPDACGR